MKRLPLLFLLATLLLGSQATAEQILHYTFDNGATDVSAHGYHGTIIGSPTVTSGQTGYALSFNNPYGDQAATQYVTLPDLTSILGQSSFTIAIKYKSTDSSGYNGRLFGNTWVNNGLCLNINSPTRPAPNGCLVNGSNYALYGNFNPDGTPVTTDGQWHRAVLSVHRDMQTAAFYIDGNPVSASAFDFFHNTSFANLAIGANGGSGYNESHYAAKAVVDDVQIFNNWMSQTAVGQITDMFPTNNNPSNQIRFNSYSAADTKRNQLINSIWSNGLPTSTLPTATTNISFPSDLNGVNQSLVASVDRLDANVSGMDFHSKSYVIHPTNTANANKLLIVHQGHQDGLAGGLDSTTNKALQEGYTVIAMQMPLMAWNTDTTAVVNGNTVNLTYLDHNDMFAKLSPTLGTGTFKMFLEPVVQNINYFKNQVGSNSEVIMTGISGGGWTTHLAAAIDTRIKLSVPVAGSAPLYSRNGFGETAYPYGDAEQWYDPLYNEQIASDGSGGGIATWLEIYALGGYGFDREQIMVTNLYDSICFSGTFADSFKNIVSDSVVGLGFGDWNYYRETDPNAGHTITANVRDNVLFAAMSGLSFCDGELVATPEPSTAMLSILGALGIVAYARRKRRGG